MNEKQLLVEEQKIIIDKIVTHLSRLGSDMYYESTINICHEIHEIIRKENFFKKTETDAVINLDANDIQTLLSYNSSCC
jgi:hypothetical protein